MGKLFPLSIHAKTARDVAGESPFFFSWREILVFATTGEQVTQIIRAAGRGDRAAADHPCPWSTANSGGRPKWVGARERILESRVRISRRRHAGVRER